MNAVNMSSGFSSEAGFGKGISEYQLMLNSKKISSGELTQSFFKEADNSPDLNVYITEMRDSALEQARKSDERLSKGDPLPLDGIPIAVKDNYCTQGVRTTAGSKMLSNFVPEYESTITSKLIAAGAILLGKTNMDEFAMGSSTETSYFGPTINPEGKRLGFPNLTPGGSSGGSASAVSANMALAAIGTDTGGSVRQPASFCGVVGFKPTYGVCSRWGIVAYASSLDQAGVFCNSVKDVSILMDVISGGDVKDSTCVDNRSYSFEKEMVTGPKKLKIGLPLEAISAGSTKDTDTTWDAARKIANFMKADIVEVSLPSFKHSLSAYYIIALSEASSNLARYDGVRYGYRTPNAGSIDEMYEKSRAEGFGPEVKRRIMLGTYALSAGFYEAYFLRAQKVRNLLISEFSEAFKKVDFMFMPTTPSVAFELGSKIENPIDLYLGDIFTVPINLAGLPAISIPAVDSQNGLPLGLQVVGPQFSDEHLVRAASSVELAAAVLGLHQ